MQQPKVGLLPLYLKLYDDVDPALRASFEPFLDAIVKGLQERGVSVSLGEICRINEEFAKTVKRFEHEQVDLLVTLHLAYSPSLESAGILAASKLPVLLLDTTPDASFGQGTSPDRIMFNHGIHGVQDLASVLRRLGRHFEIVAGHHANPDVLDRAAGIARAAQAARYLRTTRALRIGPAFEGMGDFAAPDALLERVLGIKTDQIDVEDLVAEAAFITETDLQEEMEADRARYAVEASEAVHRRSLCSGLALRKRLTDGACTAFSLNFLEFRAADGLIDTVPFLEVSKAMARGYGYAGEGDVLTASLVGALNKAFGKTTFTEIFCPDWEGDALFLSHMGEVNPEVAGAVPRLIEKDFPYTPAQNPAILACGLRPGPAVLVNLAPGPGDRFGLLVAPVQVLEDTTVPEMKDAIRGWIRPELPIELFLEEYSINGGTHHSALVLGDCAGDIVAFGSMAGLDVVTL
ncbi:MAG: L-arabinose isomerase family protein [Candidatus Hydrogenedentales bacterium]